MNDKANSRQVGGSHYQIASIQHWDIVAMHGLDYFQGQITKYVMRWRAKGGLQDLEKARHFLDKYIELEGKKLMEEAELKSRSEHAGFSIPIGTLSSIRPLGSSDPHDNAPFCRHKAKGEPRFCVLLTGHPTRHTDGLLEWEG